MSAEAAHSQNAEIQDPNAEAAEHGHGHEENLWHQFEDRKQQDESYVVGMWSFLVTEVLFFGALFLAYSLFRFKYPDLYADAHGHLNKNMGGLNTLVLLTSSLFMALGVHAAQKGWRWKTIGWMLLTIALAFVFLVVKYFEYSEKWDHKLVPGPNFDYTYATDRHHAQMQMNGGGTEAHGTTHVDASMAARAQLFFGLYFVMTGLHGIHVIVGILIMGVLVVMLALDRPQTRYYMPIEMTGLYWHFVDIVWIFLFPLFYLIGN